MIKFDMNEIYSYIITAIIMITPTLVLYYSVRDINEHIAEINQKLDDIRVKGKR